MNKVVEYKYIEREKSWLAFNARVLQEAGDNTVPLLERLRFLGIFSNNLDEFFRVRFASIRRLSLSGITGEKYLGGITAQQLVKEITEIVHNFDSRIQLSNNNLVEHFGLENGKTLLSPYFKQIELKRYDDYLIVDDAKALMNYIMSCHGNQKEYLGYRLKEFQAYLEKIIDENNGIKITKDCGLFICRK